MERATKTLPVDLGVKKYLSESPSSNRTCRENIGCRTMGLHLVSSFPEIRPVRCLETWTWITMGSSFDASLLPKFLGKLRYHTFMRHGCRGAFDGIATRPLPRPKQKHTGGTFGAPVMQHVFHFAVMSIRPCKSLATSASATTASKFIRPNCHDQTFEIILISISGMRHLSITTWWRFWCCAACGKSNVKK